MREVRNRHMQQLRVVHPVQAPSIPTAGSICFPNDGRRVISDDPIRLGLLYKGETQPEGRRAGSRYDNMDKAPTF
jgi:hypothetical protein